MRRCFAVIATFFVACAHNSAAPPSAMSVRDVVAAAEEFNHREIAVTGYWIQIGGAVSIIETTCPVQPEAINVLLSPGVVRNTSAMGAIRSMARRSGARLEPHVTVLTLDFQAAEFMGKGIFEHSVCPSEPPQQTTDYIVVPTVKTACTPYRLTLTEIARLHRVSLQALPLCIRGEPDQK